ncbi:hypothetical protein B0T14DRAFT_540074 [Immersiella caudata]|uniref:FAD-binding PCMH-type domain-containing protein n=1 Tax=Immersiella caudata TaxID=314043 RepID=A0AA40BV54_9PEZI|nr:hypothetical protein B0T14DRAFT_540074 [Immersiella caudata]
MTAIRILSCLALLLSTATSSVVVGEIRGGRPGQLVEVCTEIAARVSTNSAVVLPRGCSARHWFQSSNQLPSCIVQVGSPDDVSSILKIIGKHQAPFAVMSGGHTSNPGFSSTSGVHISLERLNQVVVSADKTTAEIGFGARWSEVFAKLEGTGLNVVGGRVVGPGVGGFTLGLTCDTVKNFNVVLPNGTMTTASATENKDLFFALKGGLNRFGIVTSATFFTHPQPGQVFGGYAMYPASSTSAVLNATMQFYENSVDPKTQIITTTAASPLGPTTLVLFFHDEPRKPPAFKYFDGIPSLVNTLRARRFSDFVAVFPSQVVEMTNLRGAFATMSTSKLTAPFLEAIKAETAAFGKIVSSRQGRGIRVNYDIEPFTEYGKFETDSAYLHSHSPLPLNLFFSWGREAEDGFWFSQMRASIERLKTVAIQEGIYSNDFTQFPNYALANTTAEELYGASNAARLRKIRADIDPLNIMSLTGGYEI